MLRNHRSNLVFLSTSSARRTTDLALADFVQLDISIHVLREEDDSIHTQNPSKPSNFYPRPPRGGRPGMIDQVTMDFYFYPRPPRGGRPLKELAKLDED